MRGFTLREVMVALVVVIGLAVTVVLCSSCSNKGIVCLEGYEHGVAFCEEQFSTVVHLDKAHVWNDGTATYVVNAGHLHDPEVARLKILAKTECAKLSR